MEEYMVQGSQIVSTTRGILGIIDSNGDFRAENGVEASNELLSDIKDFLIEHCMAHINGVKETTRLLKTMKDYLVAARCAPPRVSFMKFTGLSEHYVYDYDLQGFVGALKQEEAQSWQDWFECQLGLDAVAIAAHGADYGYAPFVNPYSFQIQPNVEATLRIYEEFEQDIWAMVVENAEKLRYTSTMQFVGTFDRSDLLDTPTGFKTLLIWYACEGAARKMLFKTSDLIMHGNQVESRSRGILGRIIDGTKFVAAKGVEETEELSKEVYDFWTMWTQTYAPGNSRQGFLYYPRKPLHEFAQ